ncbi:hypothetical protein V0U79_06185 [Hyphobacterium sp. HN65]|uniref:Tetratricopeptide repeat protein n=1 Tax=Hyphobacterium lacteum TaxID=3116575 RepID=A0ABU7LPV9_9PROT|nr:hypothetical protein [Hyphobacterium sp. HN65]MEE2525948.1 hypothetical protein [Hyphobacterium sp. HN65]
MNLLAELRRRQVFRVAAAYLVAGWIVMQVVATIGGAAGLPGWADSLALIILIAGFPVVIFIAWAFELTPEGLKKTADGAGDGQFRPLGPSDYVLMAAVAVVVVIASMQAFVASESPTPVQPGPVAEAETAPAPNRNSIAVLPFADLSPLGDQEYFSDGISEEILNVLVRVDALDVTSRTSAFQFKGQDLGIPEIAEELNVRHVLEGSVRRSGNTFRITAQLIDAQTDTHLWSETYDRPLTAENVFAIQDEIANAIVVELSNILGVAPEHVEAEALTDDVGAYDLFVEARALYQSRIQLDRVTELLDRAIAQDPDFAQAMAIRSGVSLLLIEYGYPAGTPEEMFEQTRQLADEALAIDPDNATAIAVRAQALTNFTFQGHAEADFSEILAEFDRALTINPRDGSALNWRGITYLRLGYLEDALADFRQCVTFEPRYAPCAENVFDTLTAMGRIEEAREAYLYSINHGVMTTSWTNFRLLADLGEEVAFKFAVNQPAVLPQYPRVGDIYDAFMNPEADHTALGAHAWQHAETVGTADDNLLQALLIPILHRGEPLLATVNLWQPEFARARDSESFHNEIRNTGVLDLWQTRGFPPQCRPVGEDDFECD